VCIDDIISHGDATDKIIEKLRKMFDRQREHNLMIRPTKCQFLCPEVQILRWIINKDGVHPKSTKENLIMK